jgi:hypothetical protein
MKVLVFSVALGATALITGSLSAQSGVMVAERLPESSSSQSTQLSQVVMPTKADDLPDAPQATPMNSGGAAHPSGMGSGPLLPQTFHDKFMAFAVATVGPRAFVGPAVPAAIRMANPPSHYLNDWRQGAEGFGRNYGDQLATVETLQTGRFVVGAALHEDFRYHPSTSTNFFMRTGHALSYTLVDRSDAGHVRPVVANLVGLGGGS